MPENRAELIEQTAFQPEKVVFHPLTGTRPVSAAQFKIKRFAEGKTGNECIPLNYNNNGFVYTFSQNTDLLPEDVKAAAQAAWDGLVAEANTLDYKTIELK